MVQKLFVHPIAALLLTCLVLFPSRGDAEWSAGYCQLKPDLADWTCGAHSVFPDKSMDYLQANCVFRVEFSLS